MITDNDQIKIFLPLINNGLALAGYNNVSVLQNYQATMQGVYTGPAVYFYKVMDHRYGYPKIESVYDSINDVINLQESQYRETTWQFSALVTPDITNTSSYTASDLINEVAYILASNSSNMSLQAEGFGQYRITDIRNPYFTDDRDRYEAFPSFDFTLCFLDIIIKDANAITPPIIANLEGI